MNSEINITQSELIELYKFMEKANEIFHQPMKYRNTAEVEKFVSENYPTIQKFYYDVLWEHLPEDEKNRILNK
jgi:hypothetical protein